MEGQSYGVAACGTGDYIETKLPEFVSREVPFTSTKARQLIEIGHLLLSAGLNTFGGCRNQPGGRRLHQAGFAVNRTVLGDFTNYSSAVCASTRRARAGPCAVR